MPQLYFEDIAPGQALPERKLGPITTEHLVRWAGAAGDYNPIHYDQAFAREQGLPDVIMHGPFKAALLAQALASWAGPDALIRRLNCRYTGMDVPGNVLTIGGHVCGKQPGADNLVDCELWLKNQRGEVTVKAEATLALPSKS